jgi:hypothetical protein
VAPQTVDHVEALYSIIDTGPNGMESRLAGAKLHLRPIDTLTAESVSHALVCYAARETLSGSEANRSSPYSVPGAWVDIDVKSSSFGYDVLLRGQNFGESHQILDRARVFARRELF